MMRHFLLAATFAFATPALACPMADAAAFADAAEQVKAAAGTKVTLQVDGMHCGDCSEKIATALKGLTGVNAAASDYQTGRTEVAYDAAKADVKAILAAIEKLGFKAKLAEQT
jgi:copper chaperone CopZ